MFCCADVVSVKTLDNYLLYLQFEDGKSGKVDISKMVPFEGVFEPLKDKTYFDSVEVNPDLGTICWKSGADLSPAYLRENLT